MGLFQESRSDRDREMRANLFSEQSRAAEIAVFVGS
jgi:hypothetical protein